MGCWDESVSTVCAIVCLAVYAIVGLAVYAIVGLAVCAIGVFSSHPSLPPISLPNLTMPPMFEECFILSKMCMVSTDTVCISISQQSIQFFYRLLGR